MKNHTRVTIFIIAGLTDDPQWKVVLFIFLLLTYLLSVTGNLTIITLTLVDTHLKTPMYFFLRNFSFLEFSYTTTCIPKLLVTMATGDKTISYGNCVTQVFFAFLFGASEFYLLAAMSYDRFVAICHPLHYTVIMNWRVCTIMAAVSWIVSFLLSLVHLLLILRLPFCGPHEINHFFCEILSVLKLACADTTLNQVVILAACVFILVGPLCLVLVSYTRILVTILRIQSGEGRRKAFSTCSSHLCVVGLFFGSAIVMYMAPKSQHPELQQKILSLFYSLFNPMLNPLIYSLRNAEVKGAVKRVLWKQRSG